MLEQLLKNCLIPYLSEVSYRQLEFETKINQDQNIDDQLDEYEYDVC